MTECELTATCPYFQGESQEGPVLTKKFKEEYCRGAYTWCGRYQAYKALERDRQAENTEFAAYAKHHIQRPGVKAGHS